MPFSSVADQFLLLDTPFQVAVTVTAPSGRTLSDVEVEGLLEGFTSRWGTSGSQDFSARAAASNTTPQRPLGFFGSVPSGVPIANVNLGGGRVYRITQALESLRIRVDGDVDTLQGDWDTHDLILRWATTAPTTANLTTHGTELARHSFSGLGTVFVSFDETVMDMPDNAHFWVCASDGNIFLRNRHLRLNWVSETAVGAASATVRITGTPNRVAQNHIWDVTATYDDGSTEELEILYSVIVKVPVIHTVPRVSFYRNVEARLPVFVRNYEEGGQAEAELIGMDSGDEQSSIVVSGTPDKAIPASENENIIVSAPNPMGSMPITSDQPYEVLDGTPPPMSPVAVDVGNQEATFTWAAVIGALSY